MAASTTPFPRAIKRMDQDRRNRYAQFLDFYQGRQWQTRPRTRAERQLTFNYTDTILTTVAGLIADNIRIIINAPLQQQEAAARPASIAWQQVARDNALTTLDFETELDAAIMGDACYKVTWDADADQVRITSPDVQGLFAWWLPDNPNVLTQVAQQYAVPADAALDGYGVRVSGRTATITERWTAGDFELWVDDGPVVAGPNPYSFIPYVIFPNIRQPKQFWGTSDIVNLEDVQRELNREISTLSMIMELSGNPIAVLENVEQGRDIAIKPGAVWEIPEKSRAYVLDLLARGGARLHVDYVQLLYRALHDLAQTPRSAFGDLGRSISGVAMELDMAPLTRQVKRKRMSRQAAYRRRTELALSLLEHHGLLDGGPYTVTVTWGDILPRDPGQEATRLIDLATAGLKSRTTAMAELGERDPQEEWGRAKQEQSEWNETQTVPLAAPNHASTNGKH